MLLRSLVLAFLTGLLQAQTYPLPFPREGARKLFENARVELWDVVWPKGQPSPMHQHPFDQISVTLTGGAVRVTRLDGTSTVNHSELGSVTPTAKGTIHIEEGLSDIPQHKIMVELKPSAAPAIPIKAGVPGAFPREGAIKVFEDNRVIAWDTRGGPGGRRRPMPITTTRSRFFSNRERCVRRLAGGKSGKPTGSAAKPYIHLGPLTFTVKRPSAERRAR